MINLVEKEILGPADDSEQTFLTHFLRKAPSAMVNFCWSTSLTETGGIFSENRSFTPGYFFRFFICLRTFFPGRLLPPIFFFLAAPPQGDFRFERKSDTSLLLSFVLLFTPRFFPPKPHFSFFAFRLPLILETYKN